MTTATSKKKLGRKLPSSRKDSRYQRTIVRPAKRLAALLTALDAEKIIARSRSA